MCYYNINCNLCEKEDFMNEKEIIILHHYKEIIENRKFDEYDILGFLIFIREKIDKSKCKFIHEFCDLIAHRKRNKGVIKNNIVTAINNSYEVNTKKQLKNYQGIKWNSWVKEWNNVSKELDIDILKEKKILKEITICIMSLAQDTKYYNKDVCIGKVEVFIDGCKNLCLITTEVKTDSLKVVLMKSGPFENIINDDNGFLNYPIETKRENDKLNLYCNGKKIVEV